MRTSFQAILFDFDGTLVQSNQIKRDMLFTVARTAGADDRLTAEVLDSNAHLDRFGLYREILVQIGYEGDIDDKIDELCDLYAELTVAAISKAPEIPGAEEFLKQYSDELPMYINSATPEESLRKTVEERGWAGFFRGVYGRPKSKNDIVERVKEETGLSADKILFVGDSLQDLESAQACGCPFLGVAHEPGWHYAFPEHVPILQHYRDFFALSNTILTSEL
jgi:HAD superfamily hydrolase (TIGR01549 family)